jgi:hypothetical protein
MGFRAPALVLVILCIGMDVHAEDADVLIRQGVERRRQRDDVGALQLFERAYESGRSPRALAQMALAEQALGRWVVASEHLRQALAVQGDPWITKNRGTLNEAATRVADHVGWVEIFGGPAGAEVRVDGTPRGILPLPRPLATTIGTVDIDLMMKGRSPVRRTTSVRAGETTREAFEVLPETSGKPVPRERDDRGVAVRMHAASDPAGASASSPVDEQAPEGNPSGQLSSPATDTSTSEAPAASSARVPLVIGTAVLSAGALVFAVVKHTTWLNKVDSFNNMAACDPTVSTRGSAGCSAIYNDAQQAKKLAFAGYGVAGVMAATSVILFFALDEVRPTNPRVACSVHPSARGLDCAFRF